MLAFGAGLMRPILEAAQPPITIAQYAALDEDGWQPYNVLYEDAIVSMILTRTCDYDSLRTWLAQNHLIPGSQAYTMVSNEVVDMINTRIFPPNLPYKKNKNKNGKEETVSAIIQDDPEEDNNTIESGEEELDDEYGLANEEESENELDSIATPKG